MTERFSRFTLVSGCGWLIDVTLTMGLVQLGVLPFWASLVGPGVAVTFVYIVALRVIFSVDGKLGARGFPAYVVCQICAISAASVLVALVAHLLAPMVGAALKGLAEPLSLASGAAKALVTPVTLLANFIFLRWLTRRLQTSH